ncbi:hypothetical protein KM043_003331 [Ampulex compressa]|nr:hypothetical protein KM043_003331 [Ampulex compressa]
MRRDIALLALLLAVVGAQEKYKLCATDSISENSCQVLEKGGSKVSCARVIDSADCAIRLARGEVDFGVFTAEELLLAYQFYPKEIVPIFQLKHKERLDEDFEFQAVAVVSSDIKPTGHATDFAALRDAGLCHPGFSEAQWWNDNVLKYFERKISASECRPEMAVIENEAENMRKFFGKACRPGVWATHSSFDDALKKKYRELCALCDDQATCSYSNQDNHGHDGALRCLTSGRGKVAYVALAYVRQYFEKNDTSYRFLCTDGTTQPLSTEVPCAWIKQPWNAIVARREIALELGTALKSWLVAPFSPQDWTASLNQILQEDSAALALTENTSLASYLSKGREIELPNVRSCGSPIRWCTIGDLETNKCRWIAKEALALGIQPEIVCNQANSTFQCFRDIGNNRSDIIAIDSNYGNLARTVFGLTTVLYTETRSKNNSVVVAVVRESSAGDFPVKSFRDLKGKKACFPEYGGIAWMSFVNVARTFGIISTKSCDYPKSVASLFSGACTPGIQDGDHSTRKPAQRRAEVSRVLCSSCKSRLNGSTCFANITNQYFGDYGALECLANGDGDVAFVEARNLKEGTVDKQRYRLLCANGSLASAPGFEFDEFCPLSITIDSEIVGRRNGSVVDVLDTALALLKIEDWLGVRTNVERPIRIYNRFNGTADLLFKDSTIGLLNTTSNLSTIIAYRELFQHVETCSKAILSVAANFSLIVVVAGSTLLFSKIL